jgi:ABC-type multidrug transport system ATPase subunit
MSETMLELRGVSKSFGPKRVLQEVDLTLPAGSVLGLVGKNGAGKTTLLKFWACNARSSATSRSWASRPGSSAPRARNGSATCRRKSASIHG